MNDFITINKLFTSGYFSVPDYQRDYEWTNSENSTMIDDILALFNEDSSENHFIGAIVTVPYEETNGNNKSIKFEEYEIPEASIKHIVDGQQRLTSLSIMLASIKKLIESDTDIKEQEKGSYIDFIKNCLEGPEARNSDYSKAPRLILNGNTGYYYNKNILGLPTDENPNGKLKGAKRINAAFDTYYTAISRSRDSYISTYPNTTKKDYYQKLLTILKTRLIFVEIACEKSSNAFQVFESLNGKGLDLTAADRIKNIVMGWNAGNKDKAVKWDGLVGCVGEENLTNFFVSTLFYEKGTRISKNKLPEEFRLTYKRDGQNDFKSFFSKLKEKATIFGKLKAHTTGNKELNSLLHDLDNLGTDQAYVILFCCAIHFLVDLDSPVSDYIELTKTIIKLIVRFQVCDKSMNRLDYLFGNCIKEMKENPIPLTQISNEISKFTLSEATNDVFKESFVKFSPNRSQVALFYLTHIEEYLHQQRGQRITFQEGLTVEHIIPQTLDSLKTWYGNDPIPDEIEDDPKTLLKERIGNKALIYGDDNSSASNNNYLAKRKTYEVGKMNQTQGTPKETFILIENLLKDYPTKFNDKEVEQRARQLADIALKLW